MTSESARIVPVLMSGGTGTRLWPLSRETYPKQLLALFGEETLLQQTVRRVSDPALFAPLVTVANAEHRFVIAEQVRALGIAGNTMLLEPFGRNTAAAAAVAALAVAAERGDAEQLLLLLPVDHLVRDGDAFRRSIAAGVPAARDGAIVLFGIPPTEPAIGYGYVQAGEAIARAPGVARVARFVEKPDRAKALRYCESGDFLWNSGIFLARADVLTAELARFAPDVLAAARDAYTAARRDLDFIRLDAEAFQRCPSISFDYAVMEKTDRAAIVRSTFDWNDVGSWSALWDASDKDHDGNVCHGDVVTFDTSNSYVRTEGPLVATLGLEDVIVVAMPDVVLVASRDKAQDVKQIVEELKTRKHATATQTPRVYRPWGFYQSIHSGERFQVKRITVKPGAKLSLQKHFHRAEHWVVVNGTALVTRGNEQVLLRENESIFVPLGAMHRLENPGKLPLNLIEVQSGAYLGEDDIQRFEDIYHRDDSEGT